MKLRNNFISNSSSSSFIVRVKDWLTNNSTGITKKQIAKLLKYGFFYTRSNIFDVDFNNGQVNECDADSAGNLAIWVACNEDDVIQLLVDNRIPFKGLTHYGHNAIIYDGKSNDIKIVPNYGNQALMYGIEDSEILNKDLIASIVTEAY